MARGYRPNHNAGNYPCWPLTVRKGILVVFAVVLFWYISVYVPWQLPQLTKLRWGRHASVGKQSMRSRGPSKWVGEVMVEINKVEFQLPAVEAPVLFPECEPDVSPEWVPCHDAAYNIRKKIKKGTYEFRERHCPSPGEMPMCLIPPPRGYKTPVSWPSSRDGVWRTNVPHTKLAEYKADQRWMQLEGEKVIFPGGGTFSKGGVHKYIESVLSLLQGGGEQIRHSFEDLGIRMALDIGAGVASFGGHLLDYSVWTSSFAPLDVHDAQVQFALERGIPAYVAALASKKMPYPSAAFEMIHCSWCRIQWWAKEGGPLAEVDRVLRPGGVFVWTSPAATRDDEEDREWRDQMTSLIEKLCWQEVSKKNLTVVWRKPEDDKCLRKRKPHVAPQLCRPEQKVTDVGREWNSDFSGCLEGPDKNSLVPLSALPHWPKRLWQLPPRLKALGFTQKALDKDDDMWRARTDLYWQWMGLGAKSGGIRNIMDMNAHLGGFAAALLHQPVWVYSIVPAVVPAGEGSSSSSSAAGAAPLNTLGGIVDRGLLGMAHNWCEPFSTYPRSYDFLHARRVLSIVKQQGCSLKLLLLEMDRILRPKGWVVISDSPEVVREAAPLLMGMRWKVVHSSLFNATGRWTRLIGDGALDDAIVLFRKRFWKGKKEPKERAPDGSGGGSSGEEVGGEEKVEKSIQESTQEESTEDSGITLAPFPLCPESFQDWSPCHDKEHVSKLHVSKRRKYDRHCPSPSEVPQCRVPQPPNYHVPVLWPESRSTVWLANVRQTKLNEYKANQRWLVVEGDKVVFPGGGTYGSTGADVYLQKLGNLLIGKKVSNGFKRANVRVVLDVGCGVASFGASLLDVNVVALGFAPADEHFGQVQYALERGLPATLGAIGGRKQPQSAHSFDLIHCSWCRINWGGNNGENIVEVDRLLRPGGFFVWTSPAVARKDEKETRWRVETLEVIREMCWELVANKSLTLIYQKPTDDACREEKQANGGSIPMCPALSSDETERVFKEDVERCLVPTPLEPGLVLKDLPPWPERMEVLSPRLARLGVTQEQFDEDSAKWRIYVRSLWKGLGVESRQSVRNVLVANAKWGGAAAALSRHAVWVMNVVDVAERGAAEMMGAIHDRGFIGQLHSWCEALSTYPRTYDLALIDMDQGFSRREGCGGGVEYFLLEMDRVLRPKGFIVFWGSENDVEAMQKLAPRLQWRILEAKNLEGEEGGRVLLCQKGLSLGDDESSMRLS